MAKLDKERRLVADRVKKFEKAAHEIHVMAGKIHKKMEKLHMEAIATRDRARAARQASEAVTLQQLTLRGDAGLQGSDHLPAPNPVLPAPPKPKAGGSRPKSAAKKAN